MKSRRLLFALCTSSRKALEDTQRVATCHGAALLWKEPLASSASKLSFLSCVCTAAIHKPEEFPRVSRLLDAVKGASRAADVDQVLREQVGNTD